MMKTDWKGDELAESMNGKRQFLRYENENGTESFLDVSEYKTIGDEFGPEQLNEFAEEANNLLRETENARDAADVNKDKAIDAAESSERYAKESENYAEDSESFSMLAAGYAKEAQEAIPQDYQELLDEVEEIKENYKPVEVDKVLDVMSDNAIANSTVAKALHEQNEDLATLDSEVDTLMYNENHGGKNIFDEKIFLQHGCSVNNGVYTGVNSLLKGNLFEDFKANTRYAISFYASKSSKNHTQRLNISFADETADRIDIDNTERTKYEYVTPKDKSVSRISFTYGTGSSGTTSFDSFQIEEGTEVTEVTEYKPYIMSNNQLTNAVDTIGTTTNLLNPTLQSQVVNGLIVTKNNDGSITFSGTNQSASNILLGAVSLPIGTYKLCGFPSSLTGKGYLNYGDNRDRGSGIIFSVSNVSSVNVFLSLNAGDYSFTLKPMITTNLQADYSQFVPYTGSTGHLNSDVAEIRNGMFETKDFTFLCTTSVEESSMSVGGYRNTYSIERMDTNYNKAKIIIPLLVTTAEATGRPFPAYIVGNKTLTFNTTRSMKDTEIICKLLYIY